MRSGSGIRSGIPYSPLKAIQCVESISSIQQQQDARTPFSTSQRITARRITAAILRCLPSTPVACVSTDRTTAQRAHNPGHGRQLHGAYDIPSSQNDHGQTRPATQPRGRGRADSHRSKHPAPDAHARTTVTPRADRVLRMGVERGERHPAQRVAAAAGLVFPAQGSFVLREGGGRVRPASF